MVEKELTIQLQLRRPELFFLHAAAVARDQRCLVISAPSGVGKSTLCWTLCHNGFSYMSDELAPIDLDSMQAYGYPHAVCLKRATEGAPGIPAATLKTESTLHVPVEEIPGHALQDPVSIGAVVFLIEAAGSGRPRLSRISTPEGAARLYANGLNQLAHDRDGLRAAARIAGTTEMYIMERGTPAASCAALSELFR